LVLLDPWLPLLALAFIGELVRGHDRGPQR
jgi:hypothetical protein